MAPSTTTSLPEMEMSGPVHSLYPKVVLPVNITLAAALVRNRGGVVDRALHEFYR